MACTYEPFGHGAVAFVVEWETAAVMSHDQVPATIQRLGSASKRLGGSGRRPLLTW